MESFQKTSDVEGIAVIGMAGRFPGARNLDEFWRNLRDGVESISFFTDEEIVDQGVPLEVRQDPRYVKAWSTLDDVDQFGASFFGYSPAEARDMDPQQRIFLECAWEALENAGYDSERFKGNISVYAGASLGTYMFRALSANQIEPWKRSGFYRLRLTNRIDHLAPRVAYKLGLQGGAVTVQTSCSSSLVAVHLACQSLLTYQTDIALSGGVTINTENSGYLYEEGMILSPDGHCRVFDARAKGTIFGSGVGVVVLKRLVDALTDNDTILAVIRGAAINNDGANKVGYTAPGVQGQAEVIALAQELAGVDPATISYIEAHGTGTPLGDPIEVAALTRAFRARTSGVGFCALGSVKTNIGHLDAAAGIAGLLKTVLSLREQQLPPSLHFEEPNPEIDFANSPFYVNTSLAPWKTAGEPRRAGVSSFGVGGTNAHVILEEAPRIEPSAVSRAYQVFTLSAKTQSALQTMRANLVAYLERHCELSLPDVAYTLQVGRRVFEHRMAIVGNNLEDAIQALKTAQPEDEAVPADLQCPVIFLFPEKGVQFAAQVRELYQNESAFRVHVDQIYSRVKRHLEHDIRSLLFIEDAQSLDAVEQLARPECGYPALFLTEYALARMWMDWGVQPCALIGRGCGEYVAACLAGVFSLEDAIWLTCLQGRLEQQHIAMERSTRRLPEVAAQQILRMDLHMPGIPYISGATAAQVTIEQATDPNYWMAHLLCAESYAEGFRAPLKDVASAVMVEVGPGQEPDHSLNTWPVPPHQILPSLRNSQDQPDGGAFVSQTLASLWLAGVPIDWESVHAGDRRRRLPLPTYPFERQRYWIDVAWMSTMPTPQETPTLQDISVEGGASAPSLGTKQMSCSEPETSTGAHSDEIEQSVATIWQRILGIDEIDADANFFDLGGDSVIALMLVPHLEKAFQVKVPVIAILENPTIALLARHIEDLFLKELENLTDEEARHLKQSL